MHKHAILTTVFFGIVFAFSANAATKCIALDSSSTCTGTPVAGKADWTATCNNIPITGVGVCSSTAGSAIGETADSIATENTTDANKYCWCKMTSPALSPFVFVNGSVSAANCSFYCTFNCVRIAVSIASFRAGLFSNMQ